MEINNNFFHCIILVHCWLNVLAVILGAFRSDAQRITKDLGNFIRLNKWYITLGVVMVVFTLSPFTIPYTIKNIFNRLKDD